VLVAWQPGALLDGRGGDGQVWCGGTADVVIPPPASEEVSRWESEERDVQALQMR